jgi:hypothetical protein
MSIDGIYKVIQLDGDGKKPLREIIFENKNQIHFDDNIETIQTKIILELFKDASITKHNYNAKDLYLFCKKVTELNSMSVIQTLKNQGSRNKIDETNFNNFFLNIVSYCNDEGCTDFIPPRAINPKKLELEILKMRLDGKKYIVYEVLGRKDTLLQYPIIVCDPFKTAEKIIPVNDPHNLLLDSGPILDNTIYMYIKEPASPENENTIKRSDYQKIKNYETEYSKVNSLYNLLSAQDRRLVDVKEGITKISLSILPEANHLSVSTENLFKIIHATRNNPLVAYQPKNGKSDSIVYRLFSEHTSKDDFKIPFIRLADINKIKVKEGAVLVLISYGKHYIICQISTEFEITITCDFIDTILSESDVNTLIYDNVNPVLQNISRFFERVGYKLSTFTSLNDTHRVKINNMSYTCVYNGPVFNRRSCYNVIFKTDKEGIVRYLRVTGNKEHGFKTIISKTKVTIEGIDNIYYLFTLPIYLKSLAVQSLLNVEEMKRFNDICNEGKLEGGDGSSSEEDDSSSSVDVGYIASSSTDDDSESKDEANKDYIAPPSTDDDSESKDEANKDYIAPPSTDDDSESKDEANKDYIAPPSTDDDSESKDEANKDYIASSSSDDSESKDEANKDYIATPSSDDSESKDEGTDEGKSREDDSAKLAAQQLLAKNNSAAEEEDSAAEEEDSAAEEEAEDETIVAPVVAAEIPHKKKKLNKEGKANAAKITDYLKASTKGYTSDNIKNYGRYCFSNKKPIILTQKEIEELRIKDKSLKDKGRVLTEGKYNFVCESFKKDGTPNKNIYPKFSADGQGPCCQTVNKDVVFATGDTNHVTIFSNKNQLKKEHWSTLPLALNNILNSDSNCGVNKINDNKNKNTKCFLIYGVEESEEQSFISCVSSAVQKNYSVNEMKREIIDSLTLDNFIKYQNGNLVTDFQDSLYLLDKCDDVMDIKKLDYDLKASTFFKKLDMDNKNDKEFFKKVLSAYINFITYLLDDTVTIDYTYLWDIVTWPNEKIFENGINLIIINTDEDGKLSVICPSNHYSVMMYDENKRTLFLIRKETKENRFVYEPIYFRDKKTDKQEKKITIVSTFLESNTVDPIIKLLSIIKPILAKCKPLHYTENELYNYKNAMTLEELINSIPDNVKKKQIVSYDNKVIGVKINNGAFIPCYPSSISDELDYEFVKNNDIWETYEKTIYNLKELSTNYMIPCKPINKIVDEANNVVGILTEANQFIQLVTPEKLVDLIDDDIPPLEDYNYILTPDGTVPLLMSNKLDKNRMDRTKRFKLENDFYNAFRSTIKVSLNDFEDENSIKIRDDIENEIESKVAIYTKQITKIRDLLKKLIGNKVIFTDANDYYRLIDDVSTCVNKEDKECEEIGTCSKDGLCSLIIPTYNLINEKRKNEDLYYKKMADELIRYHHIRKQMFSPKKFIIFSNIDYDLRNDEVILLGSELTNYFIDDLIPISKNKYANFNAYDEVNPKRNGKYIREKDEEIIKKTRKSNRRKGGKKTRRN